MRSLRKHRPRILSQQKPIIRGHADHINVLNFDLEKALSKLSVESIDLECLVNINPLIEALADHMNIVQGDLEKAMGNRPVESMDRERAFIPQLQIQFLDHIAIPVFRLEV